RFSAFDGSQRAPDVRADRVVDEAYRTVGHQDVDAAGVVGGRGDGARAAVPPAAGDPTRTLVGSHHVVVPVGRMLGRTPVAAPAVVVPQIGGGGAVARGACHLQRLIGGRAGRGPHVVHGAGWDA